jgi:hypothetical protein
LYSVSFCLSPTKKNTTYSSFPQTFDLKFEHVFFLCPSVCLFFPFCLPFYFNRTNSSTRKHAEWITISNFFVKKPKIEMRKFQNK